jgi:hypothetical protein
MPHMTWRRWLVVGVLSVVTLVGVIYWRSGQVWDAMRASVDAKQRELTDVSRERPVLWGEATAGVAFDAYTRACELIKVAHEDLTAPDGDTHALVHEWTQVRGVQSKPRDAFLASVQDALAALRDGAHRRLGGLALDWELGLAGLPGDFVLYDGLASVAVLQAQDWIRQEESVAAVQALLDAMQFGRDLFVDHRLIMSIIGGCVIERAANSLWTGTPGAEPGSEGDSSILATLSPEALAVLAEGLARLDRPPAPLGECMATETVLLVRQIDSPSGIDFTGMGVVWEMGFASRFLVADAVHRLLTTSEVLPANGAPWSSLKSRIGAAESELTKSFNPLVSLVVPRLGAFEARRRTSTAVIRTLRMAVADARGESEKFADPFGGTLRTKVVDGRTHYWSVGSDGRDDGGDATKDLVRIGPRR